MPPAQQNISPNESDKAFVTIDGYRYDVTNFIRKHPGGNVIKYYVADHLDATDAYYAFHSRSESANKWLATLPKEKVDSPNDAKDPLVADFRKLREELWNEGYYKPMVGTQILRAMELIFLYFVAWYICTSGYWFIGGILRAVYLGRNGLFMHDSGHRAMAGNMKGDRFLHWLIFAFGTTASPSFWNNQHNKHHAATQELEHDIDLNTLPLIAFNSEIAKKGNKLMMRLQYITFLPAQLLLFFLWKFTHTRHMFRTKNYYELSAAIVNHVVEIYLYYSYIGFLGMLTVTAVGWSFGGLYLASIFSLNHTHKPVAPKYAPRDWVRRAAGYTTNLKPTWFVVWLTGYLNYQVEHHLFPTIPHPRLPYVAPKVKALLQKHNVPYDVQDFWSAVVVTFSNLYHVGHDDGNTSKKTL
jgi:fatty acid desaturase